MALSLPPSLPPSQPFLKLSKVTKPTFSCNVNSVLCLNHLSFLNPIFFVCTELHCMMKFQNQIQSISRFDRSFLSLTFGSSRPLGLVLLTASAYLVVQVELLMKSWFLAQNLIQVYLKNYLYFPSLLPSILMKIQYSTFSSCKICSVSFDTTKEGALFIFSFHCIKLIF